MCMNMIKQEKKNSPSREVDTSIGEIHGSSLGVYVQSIC